MSSWLPRDRPIERIGRCVFGLALFGVGIAAMLAAELGAPPWDVFHTGVSELTGTSVGLVIIATGVVLLALWVPLRERPGLGTVLNAIEIGLVVEISLPLMPETESLMVRAVLLVGGLVLIALGSGFYIGAGLGPGPRDGLMTGLARRPVAGRSVTIRAARTGIELTVLAVGIVLGGAIGAGTALFALAIGPLVQLFLEPLTMGPPDAATSRRFRVRP